MLNASAVANFVPNVAVDAKRERRLSSGSQRDFGIAQPTTRLVALDLPITTNDAFSNPSWSINGVWQETGVLVKAADDAMDGK